jgi:hypothetical protein
VWTVQIIPDGGAALPSSLSTELGFTIVPGDSSLTMAIVDNAVIDTNSSNPGAANDTWYYNETSAGSGDILWNISDPAMVTDTEQNVGFNPYTTSNTEGLYTDATHVFAALGSDIIASGATSVDTLQIVTQGGGGILRLDPSIVGQDGVQSAIATQDFYVTGDFDGTGEVGPTDLSLLLFAFGQHYTTQANWDGFLPVAPSGIVGPADLSNLLFNFNAGIGFGGGAVIGGSDVPEPTSLLMVGVAATMLTVARRRRRNK